MRFYVKVADPTAGVGWTRGFWTRREAESAADYLAREYAPAVWIYTARERNALREFR